MSAHSAQVFGHGRRAAQPCGSVRLLVIGHAKQQAVLTVFDKGLRPDYGFGYKAVGSIAHRAVKVQYGVGQYCCSNHVVAAAQRWQCVPVADYVVACAYPHHTPVDAYGAQHCAYQACAAFAISVALGQYIVRTVGTEGVFAVLDGYISYIASYPSGDGVGFGLDVVLRNLGGQSLCQV